MYKRCVSVVVAAAVIGTAGGVSLAATWTNIGTSGFVWTGTSGDPSNETFIENQITDANRVKFSSLVVDNAGNVFATCNYGENITSGGGVTIFKADGSKVDVNIQALGYPGGITKLVLGGDGKVYGAQNYTEVNWSDSYNYKSTGHNILRFNLNGTVDRLWNPQLVVDDDGPTGSDDHVAPYPDRDMIRGIATGPGGHIYWILNGESVGITNGTNKWWQYHCMWRYNITSGTVESSPLNASRWATPPGTDNGWGQAYRANVFEYVGGEWFVIVGDSLNASAIAWDKPRRPCVNEKGNPDGWGSDKTTALVYDARSRKLWHGSRAVGSGADYTAIMFRWTGSTSNPGLFTADVDAPKTGIAQNQAWHMNGNDPNGAGGYLFRGKYWCSALAVNPADGRAWMAWEGDKYMTGSINYVGNFPNPAPPGSSSVGTVWTIGPTDVPVQTTLASEGSPKANAYIVALTFGKQAGSCYVFALTLDRGTGSYDLYRASVDCPPKGACCGDNNGCSYVEAGECSLLGGIYSGDGTTCSPNICDVSGACCQRKNVCTSVMQSTCTSLGGHFNGVGSSCANQDCRYQVCQIPRSDTDGDGDVDQVDFAVFQRCLTNGAVAVPTDPPCSCLDVNTDGTIDGNDFAPFTNCGSGPGVPTLCPTD